MVRRRLSSTSPELHRPPSRKRGDQTAIIWEGDDPSQSKHITYRSCTTKSAKWQHPAHPQRRKGDRVTIYLPMIPEAAYAMLACARIRRHPFGGVRRLFARQPGPAYHRLPVQNHHTADEGLRGGKKVPHEAMSMPQIAKSGGVDWVVVVKRSGAAVRQILARFLYTPPRWTTNVRSNHNARGRPAVHPLHVRLDGQPKGVLHTSGGYLVFAAMTHQYVFDYQMATSTGAPRRRLGHRPQLHPLWRWRTAPPR